MKQNISILLACFFSTCALALTIDDDLSGTWKLSIDGKEEIPVMTFTRLERPRALDSFSLQASYEVSGSDLMQPFSEMGIIKNFEGRDHIAWLILDEGGEVTDWESNMIMRIEEDKFILGGDIEEEEMATLTRIDPSKVDL